jgi:rubrerythrin
MMEASLNPLEALQLALKREVAAEQFYLHAAQVAEEESSRQMYQFLAAEERKHQRIIQDEIDKNFLKEM